MNKIFPYHDAKRSGGIFKVAIGIISFMLLGSGYLKAQSIDPVDVDKDRPEQPRLHYYDKHGERLPEPVLFLADTDTVTRAPISSPYPLFNGIDLNVNFFDAILLAAGQSYASFDIGARVSLHNWFFPTIEAGLGFVDHNPETGNYTYKSSLSPYFKIGFDYNFLYKSNPDYQVFLGLRFGMAHVKYQINDVTVNAPYWHETEHFNIGNQSSTPIYGDILAGIKVKIWKAFSMGWSLRWHYKIHTPAASGSKPWFIPGYGASSGLGASFALIFTIGQKNAKTAESE